MNRLKFFFAAIITLTLFNISIAQDIKRFEFESAYVEKTFETKTAGIEIKTTKKIYITEYGNKMASYDTEIRNILMLNTVDSSRSVSITDGEWVTAYDPDTNEGTRMKIPFLDTIGKMSEEDMEKFGKQMAEALKTDITDVGTKEIAGKTCNVTKAVTDMMGMKTTTTTALYKNFVMEIVSEGMGTNVNELVTKFEEGIDINPTVFEAHKDVIIKEIKTPF